MATDLLSARMSVTLTFSIQITSDGTEADPGDDEEKSRFKALGRRLLLALIRQEDALQQMLLNEAGRQVNDVLWCHRASELFFNMTEDIDSGTILAPVVATMNQEDRDLIRACIEEGYELYDLVREAFESFHVTMEAIERERDVHYAIRLSEPS